MSISGPELKHILKKEKKLKLQDVAAALGMTVQGLGNHFRSKEVSRLFLLRLKDKLKVDLLKEEEPERDVKPSKKLDNHILDAQDEEIYTTVARITQTRRSMADSIQSLFEKVKSQDDRLDSQEAKLDDIGEDIADLQGTRLQIYGRLEVIEKQLKIVHHDK